MRPLTAGLITLRATGMLALVLLLWNPLASRSLPPDSQPIVLLDASLSMVGVGGPWEAARDTARALAGPTGGLVWRFGARVTAFDTAAPVDGASRLAPALEAAAARGGAVIVVTDGAVDDAAVLPADLARRPRIVVLPRSPFRDAFVAGVEGQRRVSAGDTIRLRVGYGTAGKRETLKDSSGTRVTLTASLGARRLASRPVELPDSGIVSTELTFPVSRFPSGWSALDVRLEGVADPEPRDDARRFAVEVSPQPAAVVFASPPDWETRFLARTIADVAGVPVRTFVEAEPDRWRDAATLAPVGVAALQRAAQGARLVVLGGDPDRSQRFAGATPQLVWASSGAEGDWYVERPLASPIAAALAGIAWDSLPPATAAAEPPHDSGAVTTLTARLARRGPSRPIVVLSERDGERRVTVTATGLWRWSFRGGAAGEAYRALVAGLCDWLLGARGAGSRERAVPVALEVENGLPLRWRWTGSGDPRALAIALQDERGAARTDTLRFDGAGGAELRLPPGAFRYHLVGGTERGLVVVEQYSEEWRPRAPVLAGQAGLPEGRLIQVGLRDRWWLFVIAIAAFAAEWAWRRRQGLP